MTDLERAIEWMEIEKELAQSDCGNGYSRGYADGLQALRQYQKPSDAKVLAALSWFEEMDKCEIVHRIKATPDYTSTMPDTVINTILDALRQMRKPSKWIPVSERLPEPINQTSGTDIKNTYLVARYENCNPKGYFYGYQLARYWKSGWSGIDGSYSLSVTHWMPLPKPPESDACK